MLMAQALLAADARAASPPVSLPSESWVAADGVLRLPPEAHAGLDTASLHAFIAAVDVSALLRRGADGALELHAGAARWPAGEHELVLHDGTDWRELGRWPVRVLTRAGFEHSKLQPRLDLGSDGRLKEDRSDGRPLSPRGSYRDGALNAGVQWQGQRGGNGFELSANSSGHTQQQRALRFSDRGAQAPRIDLADYRAAWSWDEQRQRLEVGHLAGRNHALLVQDLARRGVALHLKPGAASDLALHAVHGSQIVGWDDPTGLGEPDHRVHLMSYGLELQPERPGGLRLEFGLLDAALLPRRDFAAGHVPDAERSRGLALRLTGSTADGRWRGDAALARSRFVNPFDPNLARDGDLQPVREVTRNAQLAELQWQALKPPASDAGALALQVSARYERADPLYRSLAASVAPDQRLGRLSARAGWRGADLFVQAQQRVDNLERVPTLLRTRTDEHLATLQLPLARWRGQADGASWWPSFGLSWQRVHQYAVNLPAPELSGFAASQRPDQMQTTQQLQLAWRLPAGQLGWNINRNQLDNRQVGRERADQRGLAQQWNLGWAINPLWQWQGGVQQGRQLNVETGATRHNEGLSLGLNGRPDERWTISIQFSGQLSRETVTGARSRSLQWHNRIGRRFDLPGLDKALPAQWTLGLGLQAERQSDPRFGLDMDWRGWWLDLGLSVGFF